MYNSKVVMNEYVGDDKYSKDGVMLNIFTKFLTALLVKQRVRFFVACVVLLIVLHGALTVS